MLPPFYVITASSEAATTTEVGEGPQLHPRLSHHDVLGNPTFTVGIMHYVCVYGVCLLNNSTCHALLFDIHEVKFSVILWDIDHQE